MSEANQLRSLNDADRCLRDEATNRLSSGTGTPPGTIRVQAEDGWILLSGEVDYVFQQQAVALQLLTLGNSRGVRNGVTIRPRMGRTIWDDFLGRDTACSAHNDGITLSDLTLAPNAAQSHLEPSSSRTLP